MIGRIMRTKTSGAIGTGELATLLALASDGNVTISSSTNWSNTQDAVYRKRFQNLTINAGVVLSLANRGLMSILVDGNLTLNGTISMTKRGMSAGGSALTFTINGSATKTIMNASGASGASAKCTGIAVQAGGAGSAAGAQQTGGGGGGGFYTDNKNGCCAGAGGTGTHGSGGAGGAGLQTTGDNQTAGSGSSSGGAGGNCLLLGGTECGGGAGNPGGYGCVQGAQSGAGEDGTGGVVSIIVLGNITLASGSKIECKGANGEWGNTSGGGGSGGGSAQLWYGGSCIDNGCSFDMSGGSGGGANGYGASGGAGGAGSYAKRSLGI